MSDKEIAGSAEPVAPSPPTSSQSDVQPFDHVVDPSAQTFKTTGDWKYFNRKIGPFVTPWFASPEVQLGLVAFVCFLCPGMFNALGGMGGGGRTDPTLADDMNTALYSTFAVFGFFGGTLVNKWGVRLTLALGGMGYSIYATALLVSLHTSHSNSFGIIAGALLGFCAALLWTAQGTIMISYPKEDQKGRYFAWFWAIFNLGAVVGGLIPLGENIHVTANHTVNDGTYVAFIVLMVLGAVLALCLCNATDIVRKDGTRVVVMQNPSYKTEFIGLWETIKFEPYVVLLFPMFFASNWFITYQVNSVNSAHFSTRTKALNSVLYYMAQIVGALGLGYLLDIQKFRRSVRAKAAWVMLLVVTMAIWGGGYAFAKGYTRASAGADDFVPTDWKTPGYVGPMFLYIFYGLYDALWQATVYWYMGALSNSGRRAANYVGFYKGIQSAGAAVMWALDSHKLSYMGEFASNWALLSGSLIISAPVIFTKIKDHVNLEDDVVGTDDTVERVRGQGPPGPHGLVEKADAIA